jgi:hypothetical protein
LAVGVVDVREVAHAHVVAGFKKEATGRHILSGTNTNIFKVAQTLLPKYKDYPIPRMKAPIFLSYLVGPYMLPGMTRDNNGNLLFSIRNNFDVEVNFDNSKSKKDLGIEYRPIEVTTGDMMEQLIALDVVKKVK